MTRMLGSGLHWVKDAGAEAPFSAMTHLIQRAAKQVVSSAPNYLEVTAAVGVVFAARLVMLPSLWRIALPFCSAVAVLAVGFALASLGKGQLFRYLGWVAPRRPVYWLYALAAGVGGGIVALSLLRVTGHGVGRAPVEVLFYGVTVGPLIEEVLFRGAAYTMLQVLTCGWNMPGVLRRSLPTLGSAGLFAIVHTGARPLQLAVIFLMGVGYGILRGRSRSVAASTLMHASYNLTVALAILAAHNVQ